MGLGGNSKSRWGARVPPDLYLEFSPQFLAEPAQQQLVRLAGMGVPIVTEMQFRIGKRIDETTSGATCLRAAKKVTNRKKISCDELFRR
jgi:hypothetical protein